MKKLFNIAGAWIILFFVLYGLSFAAGMCGGYMGGSHTDGGGAGHSGHSGNGGSHQHGSQTEGNIQMMDEMMQDPAMQTELMNRMMGDQGFMDQMMGRMVTSPEIMTRMMDQIMQNPETRNLMLERMEPYQAGSEHH